MPRPGHLLLLLTILSTATARAQPWSLLIKGGLIIDPQSIEPIQQDIAIKDGRIVRIDKHLDPKNAHEVIDATGNYVTPGLIDMHTHDFFGTDPQREYDGGPEGMIPDRFAPGSGITTVVDAGSSGWRDFQTFKEKVIDHSKTRVLAFLNIGGAGMRGRPYEQDTAQMQAGPAAAMARRYPSLIVGFKVAHYYGPDWHPVDAAVKAGRMAGRPVMIDFGEHLPPLPIERLFDDHLRPGDIFTHCFAQLSDREAIVDTLESKLKPFVAEARQRGIVFDLGYGGISFAFSQAIPALQSGFLPNSLSTDMHRGVKHDLLYIMSTFLAMGVDLPTVIYMVTINPAREINHPELGRLQPGSIADVTILKLHQGRFIYSDHTGGQITGNQKLECLMTIKGGVVVYRKIP